MSESPSPSRESDNSAPATSGYAPYGQLVKMLLPSTGSLALYDAAGELVWCSDGYERPDLRALLESLRNTSSDTLAGRGSVQNTTAGVPAFVSLLNGDDGLPLGSLVLELSQTQSSRYSGSMVSSLLRPVLDCLESRMNLERTAMLANRNESGELEDLLLSVDEHDRDDLSALEVMLRHCVEHLGCALGAIILPDKDLTVSCALDDVSHGAQLLDRTQRHLLAWAQLNNRPMVVNRVAGSTAVAPYKILSCPIRDPNNRVTGLVALFRAASGSDFELRDVRILEFVSRKTIAVLSSQYDALTGLVNRLIFERRVQAILDSPTHSHALLYVDIDKLQRLNDAFGFQAGDEVIQRVAEVVRRVAPQSLATRLGGDRFALFLAQGSAQAAESAKRVLLAAAQLGYVNGTDSVPVSVSIGVASVDSHPQTFAHLLAAAELACKRAKQQGRNKIVVQDSSTPTALHRRRDALAASTLQDALRNSEFRLEAQPIVRLDAQQSETLGYELLVRMRSASGELLSPDKFLDAAERYALLPALDRWVLCTTLEILKAGSVHEAPCCYGLNVSAQSLATGKYGAFVLEQLAQSGIPPSQLWFELKESAAVIYLANAEQLIRELTDAGCRIALDDFGYGLSSLAHLKRLPVQYLKIDGRFVRRILEDRVAESIVSGIARASRTLGVTAIAEHVESAAVAARLRDLDVDFGQGFFLGRPESFAKPLDSEPRAALARSFST